jgi:hypothetical protein
MADELSPGLVAGRPLLEPMTLQPSVWCNVWIVITGGVLLALGVPTYALCFLPLWNDNSWVLLQAVGGGACLLGALICVVGIVSMRRDANSLQLDSSGFTTTTLFASSFIRWADVKQFRVISVRRNRMVGIELVRPVSSAIVRWLGDGCDGILPSNYGRRPDELALLMNEWKSLAGPILIGELPSGQRILE